jgi:hypothetical protein
LFVNTWNGGCRWCCCRRDGCDANDFKCHVVSHLPIMTTHASMTMSLFTEVFNSEILHVNRTPHTPCMYTALHSPHCSSQLFASHTTPTHLSLMYKRPHHITTSPSLPSKCTSHRSLHLPTVLISTFYYRQPVNTIFTKLQAFR